ncbi:uncharacterized protein MCAP_0864-like [Dysidea avara]|uniref:uncharacterized protein MCAP_0864-like n=1 Tax=Dysidea avara TaxID=196820 RepID=UPI00332046C8
MEPATTPKKTDSSEIEAQKALSPASLNEMESRMRDEIRKLQERRVTVLMDEVTQLQSERDNLIAKINSLEKENQAFKEENSTLKANEKPSIQVTVLERALQQEKDEKDKLKQRLRVIKKRTSGLSITNLSRERSGSMNDMESAESTDITDTIADHIKPKVELKPAPSPRGKRYVLAATSTNEVGTQTTLIPHVDSVAAKDDDKKTTLINEDMRATLSEARSTIIEILQEKEAIEVQLEQQVNESSALRENVQNTITALQTECTQLTSGFNQFKQWVNKKMRDMQEEMDICKVIYTLHGSLSKEATLIEQLTEKVQDQKRFITKLQSENSQLETKLVSTQKDIKDLKRKQKSNVNHVDGDLAPYPQWQQQPDIVLNVQSPVV